MKLMSALLYHAWLAITFKHKGNGMPTGVPAATLLVTLYSALYATNSYLSGLLSFDTFLGISFIAQMYVFSLRNPLLGLVILIGIISNAITLLITLTLGNTQSYALALSILEFGMIFSAVVNIIKHHSKLV